MLTTAAILFALGALGGLFMATRHFQGRSWPLAVAVLHGLLGATGLVLLAWVVFQGLSTGGYLMVSLVLFVVAALGGVVLFAGHLRGRPLSTPLIVVHAVVAVTAFVLLLLSL